MIVYLVKLIQQYFWKYRRISLGNRYFFVKFTVTYKVTKVITETLKPKHFGYYIIYLL